MDEGIDGGPSSKFGQPQPAVPGPAPAARVGVAPGARRPYEHLPPGVGEQIAAQGENPMHFVHSGGMLMKSLDHLDRRPSEAPAAAKMMAPPSNVPTVMPGVAPRGGVQAPAQAARVGVGGQAPDPVRAGMMRNYQEAERLFRGGSDEDFARHRAEMFGMANGIQDHDMGRSQIAANDPMKQIGVMKELAKPQNRDALDVYNAGKGVDPNVIPRQPIPSGPGQPGVTVQNLDQHLGLPQNAALAAVVNDPNADFLGQLRQFGQFPGAADAAHPNHQIFQAYVNRKYSAREPYDWNADTYHTPWANVFNRGSMGEANTLLSRYGIRSPFAAQPQ